MPAMTMQYDYLMAVWLHVELPDVSPEFEDELRDYLEAEFQVNKLDLIEDEEATERGEVVVSLRIQTTFDETQMDDEEPTEEAVAEFDAELRPYLEAKYTLAYFELLDDAPGSYLLNAWDDSDLPGDFDCEPCS
jgi:hypothetical protein